jgi:hypothetical protein
MLAWCSYSVGMPQVLEENDQARCFSEATGFKIDGVTKEVRLGITLAAIRCRKELEIAGQLHQTDAG